jgi:hypothetical protein
MTFPDTELREIDAAVFPSAAAFEAGAGQPAVTDAQKQARTDEIIQALAALLAGGQQAMGLDQLREALVVLVSTDEVLRAAIAGVTNEENSDLRRRLIELEERLGVTNGRVSDVEAGLRATNGNVSGLQQELRRTNGRIDELRDRFNRFRSRIWRNRYPLLPFGLIIGAIVGFVSSMWFVAGSAVTSLRDVVDGKNVVVDSITEWTPWQYAFVIVATLAGAAIFGGIAAALRRVPVYDEIADEAAVTNRYEVNA